MTKRYYYYTYKCPNCSIEVKSMKLPVPFQCSYCKTLLYPKPKVMKSDHIITDFITLRNVIIKS